MNKKVYSFRNEDGDLVKFTVQEYLSLNHKDYVLMSPEEDKSLVQVYKFNFQNGNESLELVENDNELSQIKSVSKVM